MYRLDFKVEGDKVFVQGYPDAISAFRISGKKAKRLAALGAHLSDLEFARECLKEIQQGTGGGNVHQTAMWRCAIVHFAKCFGHSDARGRLDPGIFARREHGTQVFKYFSELRDKHVVHDANAFTQSIPAALLNRAGMTDKIATVLCMTSVANTLDQGHFNNLSTLLGVATVHVETEIEGLTTSIKADLECEKYEEMASRPTINLTMPAASDVSKIR